MRRTKTLKLAWRMIGYNICFAGKLIVTNITVEDSLADDWEIVGEREVEEDK